ncbi:serine/threonine-protein kinase PknK [Polyangium aurulentum]|uniref:serine/threonine-protein kinase n=1 Tax=Polyangium aurulentum TaxID=2567896 RepID=UPI0010AE55F4|nr:serine/threonine-protein kinase [Polyangium aurulentum]UQA62595.1 protein kinase [Polyangium aurulentum]
MTPGAPLDGRFQLVRRAAAGGMGEIHHALDQRTGMPVAVKLLSGREDADKVRFEREIDVLASLAHPHIVRHVAHGIQPSGEHYLVMEWLEGEDLSRALARRRLTVAESLTMARCAASALGFAHDRGVVHRDLKPGNVFLVGGAFDAVKILDFGIAKKHGATALTGTGSLIGTPGYMAPEQARGESAIDARADVYSLGCLLFECLTGERAFAGEHVMAVLSKILLAEAPRLRDLRPDLPPALEALVSQWMAKEPSMRPRDGHAAHEALAALGDVPETSLPAEVHERAPVSLSSTERRPVAVILIGPWAGEATAPVVPGSDVTAVSSPDTLLLREAAALGARGEPLFDGSLALWIAGSGMATDLAAQAARAALSMRAHLSGRPIALAVGRAALTGRLPFGDAIDRAARTLTQRPLLVQARGAPIALDDTTAGLFDARFDVRESVEGFSLHGERALLDGMRTLLGKPTACVGRERELGTLEETFDECVEERFSQAVLVTGPAGAGKSRLAHEFVRKLGARDEAPAVWIARGDAMRAGSAFGLLAQVLNAAFGIGEDEPIERRRERIVAAVAEHVPAAGSGGIAEFLGEIVGVPFPDEHSPPLRAARQDGGLMNDRIGRAFLDFLAAACASRPVLLVLEDLHWGDLPTVRLVDAALRELRQSPLLVFALARPEVHDLFPKLWAGRRLQSVVLRELGRKASTQLVRQVLGHGVGSDTLDRIVTRAQGNAFYLEELIRAAAEGRERELPETVVAMVQSRLGMLADEDRRILRAGSIFGEVFWVGGVAELVGAPERATFVRERLAALAERELVEMRPSSRFRGEHEVSFRHALLADGAYSMLTEEDRVLGHGLAGAWLEARGERDSLVLAEHFERGKDAERAARHYLAAAELAHVCGDTENALARARRGLDLSTGEARVPLLGLLCDISAWIFDLDRGQGYAEEAIRLAPRGSVPWFRGTFLQLFCATRRGDEKEFVALTEELGKAEPATEAPGVISFVLAACVSYLDEIGRVDLAEPLLERMTALVSGPFGGEALCRSFLHVANAYHANVVAQDPWAVHQEALRAQAEFQGVGHGRSEQLARAFVALGHWFVGERKESMREASELLDAHASLGTVAAHPFVCTAHSLAENGALAEARAVAERLVESGRVRGLTVDEGRGRWTLAGVLLRMGELEMAEREAQSALERLATSPVDQPGARATLAAVKLAAGKPDEALELAAAALAQHEKQRATAYFRAGLIRLVHIEALLATGRHDEARGALGIACERIGVIASKIADPERRRSFLDAVPENARTLELGRVWCGEPATPKNPALLQ